jgi:hypothetical protein
MAVRRIVAGFCVHLAFAWLTPVARAQDASVVEYRVLAASRTSTMQREMQEAAREGFRFGDVMGGETAFGGSEVVVVMVKDGTPGTFSYRLLATSRTSTMQRELQDAGNAGYRYRGQTVFQTFFSGEEVVVILERDSSAEKVPVPFEYRLLATSRTSTLQKELTQAGKQGFEFVGLTVGETAVGGSEVVAILRRERGGR